VEKIGGYATNRTIIDSSDAIGYLPVQLRTVFSGPTDQEYDSLRITAENITPTNSESISGAIAIEYTALSKVSIYDIDTLTREHFETPAGFNDWRPQDIITQQSLDTILTESRKILPRGRYDSLTSSHEAIQDSMKHARFTPTRENALEVYQGFVRSIFYPQDDTTHYTLKVDKLNQLWLYDHPAVSIPYRSDSHFQFSKMFLLYFSSLLETSELQDIITKINTVNLYGQRYYSDIDNWCPAQITNIDEQLTNVLDTYDKLQESPQILNVFQTKRERIAERCGSPESFDEEWQYYEMCGDDENSDRNYEYYFGSSYEFYNMVPPIEHILFWEQQVNTGTDAAVAHILRTILAIRKGDTTAGSEHSTKPDSPVLFPVYFAPTAFVDPDVLSSSLLRGETRSNLIFNYFELIDSLQSLKLDDNWYQIEEYQEEDYNGSNYARYLQDSLSITVDDTLFELMESFGSPFFNSELNYWGVVQNGDSYQWKEIDPEVSLMLYQDSDIEGFRVGVNLTVTDSDSSLFYAAFPDSSVPNGYQFAQPIDTVIGVYDSVYVNGNRDSVHYNYESRTVRITTPETESRIKELFQMTLFRGASEYSAEQVYEEHLNAVFENGDTVSVFTDHYFGHYAHENAFIGNIRYTDINGDGLWDIIAQSSANSTVLILQLPYGGFEVRYLINTDGTGVPGC